MANQFTKAEEEGREKPKGTNQFVKGTRKEHDQATKDRIRAEVAAHFLEKALKDKTADLGTKVAAAKALLPYGKSTFASIEQTNHEEPASEEDIKAQLHSLLANPGTRAQIQAMLAGTPMQVESDVQPQQSQCSNEVKAA
jgi:hypothetical protein